MERLEGIGLAREGTRLVLLRILCRGMERLEGIGLAREWTRLVLLRILCRGIEILRRKIATERFKGFARLDGCRGRDGRALR